MHGLQGAGLESATGLRPAQTGQLTNAARSAALAFDETLEKEGNDSKDKEPAVLSDEADSLASGLEKETDNRTEQPWKNARDLGAESFETTPEDLSSFLETLGKLRNKDRDGDSSCDEDGSDSDTVPLEDALDPLRKRASSLDLFNPRLNTLKLGLSFRDPFTGGFNLRS